MNCSALVRLTHLYLPGMVERRSGAILIVSSTAAYQGVPYMATYAASKGFGLLFAEVRLWVGRWNTTTSAFARCVPAPLRQSSRK